MQLGLLTVLLLAGCAGRTTADLDQQQRQTVVAAAASPPSLLALKAPAFALHHTEDPHNRIGRVRASGTTAAEAVWVDVDQPAFYGAIRPFTTADGAYTNLVYRIHFLAQPFSLVPFHLGAGRHVGLLVILTLDARRQVVLVTTANTCGCYAVSIPTAALPQAAYPDNWPATPVAVFGERLPSRLPALGDHDVLRVVVRPDVHRVAELEVVPRSSLGAATVPAALLALESLKELPLDDGGVTSFYHRHWPLTGHVKGAIKPWESLLLSLVSLDLFVGMDKEYGDTGESGNPFYTSLKPWNRQASDMNDFAAYLRFNGWRL